MPRKKTTVAEEPKPEPKVASWYAERGITRCNHCKAEPVINRLGHYELTKFCPHCGYEMLNGH